MRVLADLAFLSIGALLPLYYGTAVPLFRLQPDAARARRASGFRPVMRKVRHFCPRTPFPSFLDRRFMALQDTDARGGGHVRVRDIADKPAWDLSSFACLPETTARLRRYIIELVNDDGAVHDPCLSRALESALALRLLEKTGLDTRFEAGVRRYLAAVHPVNPFERALAECALRESAGLGADAAASLALKAPSFTGARKHAFVQALACLWNDRPELVEIGEAFSLTGLHSWARVQVTAVKVILASATGQPGTVTDEDVLLLLSTQRLPSVWEGNMFLHLLVLHALFFLPGTHRVLTEGVRKLSLHQRRDGGIPFVTDLDTWCTAIAGLALAGTGRPDTTLRSPAGHLIGRQRPGGGWSCTDVMDQTDLDNTAVAVEFLHVIDARTYSEAIRRGIRSLTSARGSDGGFPTYLAGAPSEAMMTAAVVSALSVDAPARRAVIDRALRFLADAQNPDGSFPPDWCASSMYGVFRAVLATRTDTRPPKPHVARMLDRALTYVRARQHPDGGWGQQGESPSDPLSTAYALIALCHQHDPAPAVRGLRYLREHQQPDGRITSRPDGLGPRPFVYEIPALASIFPLLALAHLTARTTPQRTYSPTGSAARRPRI